MRSLLLHNIRSEHNVGAIFRTADGAGIAKLYLAGYTPSPIDRFGRVVPEIEKTSLGASRMVSYEQVEDTLLLIARLQAQGVQVVVVEQTASSISLYDFVPATDALYIVGNEVEGVPTDICAAADVCIMIPMAGEKESLNVATATGIALFHTPATHFR
jgi:23S rRNA (guanosine2251-2'-O)-methyltransferase